MNIDIQEKQVYNLLSRLLGSLLSAVGLIFAFLASIRQNEASCES